MIDYKTLNALINELKTKNTSVDSREFFDRKLGKSKDTFKTWRISIEKLVEDGIAKKLRGNYVIITPKGTDFDGYEPQLSKGMKRVFVSHAYVDRKIAEKLVDKLLVETLGIEKDQIFFTSKRDTGIPSKVAWRDHIKQEIRSSKIFIALITPNYHDSQMCQAEMGAAWVLEKDIFSLYLPPISTKNFSAVIGERQADNLRINEEVTSFIKTLQKDYEKHFSEVKGNAEIEVGIKKFQRALRSILRKDAKELRLEYLDNEKNSTKTNFSIPEFDLDHVKNIARSEYPTDFSMQKYTIDEQESSYKELLQIIEKNKQIPELQGIMERAFSEYPKDYSMVVYTINDQLDSLSKLK